PLLRKSRLQPPHRLFNRIMTDNLNQSIPRHIVSPRKWFLSQRSVPQFLSFSANYRLFGKTRRPSNASALCDNFQVREGCYDSSLLPPRFVPHPVPVRRPLPPFPNRGSRLGQDRRHHQDHRSPRAGG